MMKAERLCCVLKNGKQGQKTIIDLNYFGNKIKLLHISSVYTIRKCLAARIVGMIDTCYSVIAAEQFNCAAMRGQAEKLSSSHRDVTAIHELFVL